MIGAVATRSSTSGFLDPESEATMLNVLALIKKLPTIDREAFRRHYEEVHVGVAKPLLRHLARYARHHVEADLVGPVEFDCVTYFGYPDQAAVEGLFATLASAEGAPIFEDEKNFMDKLANRFFEASQRDWIAGDEEDRSIFVFVARPPEMPRAECSRRLIRDHWPALLAPASDVRFAIVRDAFPLRDTPPPFDGAMQLSLSEKLDLDGWSAGLRDAGYRVAAVRTRRYVTALPVT